MKSFVKWSLVFCLAHLAATAVIYGDEATFEPSETQITLASLNDTYRVSRGLDPHKLDAECCQIAQSHADRMAAAGAMFHGGQDNIVAYNGGSIAHVMDMWRNSGGHNAWLLSATTRAGWGHAVSRGGNHYWAGAFRGSTAPAPTTSTTSGSRRGWFRFFRR